MIGAGMYSAVKIQSTVPTLFWRSFPASSGRLNVTSRLSASSPSSLPRKTPFSRSPEAITLPSLLHGQGDAFSIQEGDVVRVFGFIVDAQIHISGAALERGRGDLDFLGSRVARHEVFQVGEEVGDIPSSTYGLTFLNVNCRFE